MKFLFNSYTRYLLIYFFLAFCNFSIFAQKGSPFITNYKLKNQFKFHNRSIVQDDKQLMLFANQKGILSFDGVIWDVISTPEMPLTMYSDTLNKRIYVGCVDNIGYLERDSTGSYNYHAINKTSGKIGKVTDISRTDDKLIVLSDKFVTIFNIETYSVIKQIPNRKNGVFLKTIINSSGNLFIATENNQFYKLKNDTLIAVRIKNNNRIGKILFDFPLSKTRSLIGTDDNKLYFFGGKSVWRFNIQDQKYLDESVLLEAIPMSDSKIAISTLIGGILIIDMKTRKTLKTVNYSSGLPDNEIYVIGKDVNNSLWLSHQLGISRIDFSNPVKFYNTYPGINGRLLSVINLNNKIYVGTSESLFFLEELDDYKRARLIENKISVISKDLKTEKELKAKEDAENKGLFLGFQKKIKNFISPDNSIINTEHKRNALIRKRKVLGMQSVSHSYKKIEGIEDRCKILVAFRQKLLVGGNNGVYLIDEEKAEKIIRDYYVNNIIPDKSNTDIFYICTSGGLLVLEITEKEKIITEIEGLKGIDVYSVSSDDTSIWAGTNENVYLINKENNKIKKYRIDNKYSEQVNIQEYDNKVYVLLASKIFSYSQDKDSMVLLLSKELSYINTQPDVLWVYDNQKWQTILQPLKYNRLNEIYLNLFDNIEYIYIDEKNNTWVIDDKSNLYKINDLHKDFVKPEQNIFIKSITNQTGYKYSIQKLSLKPEENYLQITLSAPFYIKQGGTEYQYFLEGLMKTWSEWGKDAIISFPYIPSGNYLLHVKARNIIGTVSEEKNISFSIKEAFWEKDWFMISSGITVILLILIIIRLREQKLRKNQRVLEQKIKERTKTIEEQKNQLAIKNKNIQESIVYAGRIQKAIMPSEELLKKTLDDNFVFFKPRDIVSGDFYWLKQIGNYTVYAVADCTGHGVPGALLSMLGISFLNEIVSKTRFDTPDVILNRLRKKIKKTFNQTTENFESKDGMDIALCVIDHDTLQLQFAGAYNPVYIIREGDLIEIKAGRNPIGIHLKEKPFINNDFQLKKGDILYTFSDGYSDQFGYHNTKFSKRNLKKLLLKIYKKPLVEQEKILGDILKKWMGDTDQTDDILIMGVKI